MRARCRVVRCVVIHSLIKRHEPSPWIPLPSFAMLFYCEWSSGTVTNLLKSVQKKTGNWNMFSRHTVLAQSDLRWGAVAQFISSSCLSFALQSEYGTYQGQIPLSPGSQRKLSLRFWDLVHSIHTSRELESWGYDGVSDFSYEDIHIE